MLTKSDYDKLVLMAFESLKRDIKDCEEYTVSDYNNILNEEKKRKMEEAKEQFESVPQPKPTPKQTKKEEK